MSDRRKITLVKRLGFESVQSDVEKQRLLFALLQLHIQKIIMS